MEKTRIGVIGAGHLGNYHLQKYQQIDDCTIVGVCDTNPDSVNKAGECFGCSTCTDFQELIGKVDAVSIAVPTGAHYATAREFLARGVDVLLEKPITQTLEEADELIRLAAGSGALLQIGFVERFNPAVTALAEFIGQPLFIEAHRLHPFFERGTDVDVILDLMIHDLDIILHFVNSPVRQVDATGVSVLSKEVDIANARVTFENGCVANITASRVTDKKLQKIRFFDESGYHAVDFAERKLDSLFRRFDDQGKPIIGQNPVNIKMCDPLAEEVRAFVQAVRTRQQPVVNGEEGRKSLELGTQIIQKMKENLENMKR
jgi:predicted dehydrogenase